jgi:hypothetical protein
MLGRYLRGTVAAATRQFSVAEKVVSGGEGEESGGRDTLGRRLFSLVCGKKRGTLSESTSSIGLLESSVT